MTNKLRILLLLLALILIPSGCSLTPWRLAHASNRQYCKQAAEQGWCSPMCGKRQPTHCFPWKLVSGKHGDFFCTYEVVDGSIIFAACP